MTYPFELPNCLSFISTSIEFWKAQKDRNTNKFMVKRYKQNYGCVMKHTIEIAFGSADRDTNLYNFEVQVNIGCCWATPNVVK